MNKDMVKKILLAFLATWSVIALLLIGGGVITAFLAEPLITIGVVAFLFAVFIVSLAIINYYN